MLARLCAGLVLLAIAASAALPALALDAAALAVVYNEDAPASFALAAYYAVRRQLPAAQVIGVHLGTPRPVLSQAAFAQAQTELMTRLPAGVQALALAWTEPYRVDCMSITSAFAFGFTRAHCAQGCHPTAASPYFRAATSHPYRDLGVRPSMLLGARTPATARLLVERGVSADGTRPRSRAYLVTTTDAARNARGPRYADAVHWFAGRYPVEAYAGDGIRSAFDVMFYFIGARRVPHLDTLGFLPGAIADHLTSHGGVLDGDAQMSVLDWLEAGATGTYGTVVEPCNFPQKFPDPATVMERYLNGETLIEAYWKSVEWPGQGVFVGEPLARPFGPTAPAP